MDKSKQSGFRDKKQEGLHDNWKEMVFRDSGAVAVRDKDGTMTSYKSREDMKKGNFKEIRYRRK
jgi:hypothetical protein